MMMSLDDRRNDVPGTNDTRSETTSVERSLQRFRSLGPEMRLQQLLQYAKRFPELPAELQEARDAGLNRVAECQTPLFLWVSVKEGAVELLADAPVSAPTVRGFMGFLMEQLNGADPEDVRQLPDDLLDRMGLGEVLGVLRTQGLRSVIQRIKRDVARVS